MTLSGALGRAGVRSTHFYVTSLASIGLCISLWIRAKTVRSRTDRLTVVMRK